MLTPPVLSAPFLFYFSFKEFAMQKDLIFEDERIDVVNERLSLIQKKDGLTFGTDAFLLAAYMKPQRSAHAVELGAGTGIISLLCAAREKFARIDAFEIQNDFAELTNRNIAMNSLGERVSCRCADVRDVSARDTGAEVDVVFSNPPYMRTDSGKRNEADMKYIARHEVCGNIGDFCAAAKRLLKHGGKFYCVWRPDRLTELLSALRDNSLEPKTLTFVHADEDSAPSMILLCAKKGAAPSLNVSAPLILHSAKEKGGTRALSDKAQKIYDTMSFEAFK